jgi:hypothetical protein
LSTWWGVVSYTARRAGDSVTVAIEAGPVPPGGLLVQRPGSEPVRQVLVNGALSRPDTNGAVRIEALPARIVFVR